MSRRRPRPTVASSSRPWRVVWSDGERGSLRVDVRRVYWATGVVLELDRPGCRADARTRIAWRLAALTLLWERHEPLERYARVLGVSERQVRDDVRLLSRVVSWVREVADEVNGAHVSQRGDLPTCWPGIGRLLRDPPPIAMPSPAAKKLARIRSSERPPLRGYP